jgi:hypothetical protein
MRLGINQANETTDERREYKKKKLYFVVEQSRWKVEKNERIKPKIQYHKI